MEKTITIKFSTGKEIQLTESEYKELKQEFTQRRGMEIPRHPIHHYYMFDGCSKLSPIRG